MKKIIGAALALTLLGGTAAVAQPYGYNPNDRGVYDNRGFDRNDNRGFDRNANRGFDRPDFNWRRGMNFRDHRRFMVRDWLRHGLRRPARGLHWTQHGNFFLLVNARGIVMDVVFRPRFGFGNGHGNGFGYGPGGYGNRF